jgi:sarcosine oxidase subunit alpha
MSFRSAPPADPITITLDGERLSASRGESVAASLMGAGKVAIARSSKFHRPRGPACMRGACDGCLARVDGEPNVMTCMVPARDGMTIASQNTLGSRDVDFLRVTDWFFSRGVNHHELMAGVRGVETVMQALARRVAGLGLLPDAALASRRAVRRHVDALVVGAGAAGMAVGAALSNGGRAVEVIDDALRPGGSLRALSIEERAKWVEVEAPFRAALAKESLRLRSRTVAGAFYGEDLLVVGEKGAEVVTANDVVIAPGAHDNLGLFEGNDVPGVMSARAAGLLLSEEVVAGKRIVVASSRPQDASTFGEALARSAGVDVVVVRDPVRVRGTSRVRGVVVSERGRTREMVADALLVDLPRSPAYELCAQVGARLDHEPRGFVVRTDGGRIGPHVWAAGEAVGTALQPSAILEEAARVARAIMRA